MKESQQLISHVLHINFREFVRAATVIAIAASLPKSAQAAEPRSSELQLFPSDLPGPQWVQFHAAGFSRPVCGVVYRLKDTVTNGMALGGVDTGCLDFESSGLLGYCTIFNSHVPRRGPINLPLLALAVGGKTWALCQPPRDKPVGEQQPIEHVSAWLWGDLGPDQPAWKETAAEVPGWFKSQGRSKYDLPAGRVCCHTPTVVRWISPVAAEVRIRGGLWLGRNLGRNQTWQLTRNLVPITEGKLQWGPTSANPLSYASGAGGEGCLTMKVEEGDILDLSIGQPGLVGDFVGVDLTISTTSGGKVWDLAGDWSETDNPNGPWTYDFRRDIIRVPAGSLNLSQAGIGAAKEIHYWGHYPVVDVEFETDAPVGVGLRAWSPFLPGDVVNSMIPGIVFEVRLRNTSGSAQAGALAITFPGPLPGEAGGNKFARQEARGGFHGVTVHGEKASYALGVIGKENLRLGGELGFHRTAWTNLGAALPEAEPNQPGACAAVDFSLKPGATKVVRFLLTWSAPTWKGGGYNAAATGNTFVHMYDKHFPDAAKTADLLAKVHSSLLKRILAWQQVIYADEKLPLWLRDSLINVLYMITEDGYWAQKRAPLPDWVQARDGLFGLNECPRGCPQIECIPCSFYGSQPLVYFFPELQLSTIRGYQGYQYADGAPPWIFGGCTGGTPPIDFACPTKGYQWASNGISLAAIVDRFLLCHDTPDKRYAKELYPMLKKNMIYTINLRTTPEYSIGERIISMPDKNEGTEWFEAPEPGWSGMTAHIGGLHLAQLRIVERVAREVGDAEFAQHCADWIKSGAEAMEKRLWTGSYYLNYWEPETGRKSDFVFGYQLDGEWVTDHHGLRSALPKDHVLKTLETIKRCNVAITRYGAVNYARMDGAPAQVKGYGTYSYFPPEALMLAMNYMYEGQKDVGLNLAYKVWHNLICLHGYTWDMPNIMRGDVDTGERTYGNDYYQDMMLWSLPAALEGKDFSAPTKPGGLVDRILKAARG